MLKCLQTFWLKILSRSVEVNVRMRGLVVKFSGIGGGYKLSPSLLLNFPWTLQKPFYPNYPLCGIVEELRRVGPPEDGCMWDRIRNVFATKLEHSNRNTMEVPLLKALFAAWSEKWTPELALSNDVRTGSVASTSAGVSSVPTLAVASTSAADQTSQPYLKKCKEILAKSKSGYKLSRKSSVYLAILSTFSALPKFATQADQAWARIGKISQELLTPNPTVMEQIAARFYVLEHIRRNSMEQKWVHATWLVCRRIKETDGEVGRQTISKKRKAAKMTDKPLKEAKRLEGQRRGLVHENEELEDPLDSRLGFEVSHPLLPEIARYLVPESRPSNQNKFALKCIDGLLTAGSMKMTLDLHQPIEQQLSSRFSFTKSRLQGKPQSDSRSNEAHENAFWRLCVWPHVMFSAFICPEFSNKLFSMELTR
eukprot:Gregarina_sp_Poly_1__8147@NODE_470_length_8155_cov_107_631924_g376_i1_p3_GENE_NODE_470_length_8155_cov_107_631924_g376_i1NODE_470_length_8155_cov_107_631924_g376_i1_p3_ORF_typecomplete_len424_score47_82_NODE_470_length_8155_cov_107_631924_g376_i11361407